MEITKVKTYKYFDLSEESKERVEEILYDTGYDEMQDWVYEQMYAKLWSDLFDNDSKVRNKIYDSYYIILPKEGHDDFMDECDEEVNLTYIDFDYNSYFDKKDEHDKALVISCYEERSEKDIGREMCKCYNEYYFIENRTEFICNETKLSASLVEELFEIINNIFSLVDNAIDIRDDYTVPALIVDYIESCLSHVDFDKNGNPL